MPIIDEAVRDIGSQVDVEALRLFDHHDDVLPLEVVQDARQGCCCCPEGRRAADEQRPRLAARRVVETGPRSDRNRVLSTMQRARVSNLRVFDITFPALLLATTIHHRHLADACRVQRLACIECRRVVAWVGRRTCDPGVAGSIPGRGAVV